MATYTLNVNIGPAILQLLLEGGYRLCIAKKVKEKYNFLMSGGRKLSSKNVLQWKENYKVFGTPTYKQGDIEKPFSAERDIAFGQTCALHGKTLEPATGTPDDSGKFHVQNPVSSLAAWVDCYPGSSAPIAVTPPPGGRNTSTPTTTFLVRFERQLITGTMFDKTVSHAVEVSYAPGTTSHTIIYTDDSTWAIVNELGQAIAQPIHSYDSSIGFMDTGDESNKVPALCAFLSYGSRLSLDRAAESKTAVVGDEYKEGSPDQEWTLVASTTKGYFNIEGASRGSYLSIDGEPKEGTLVIHGPTKMDWKLEHVDGVIRYRFLCQTQ